MSADTQKLSKVDSKDAHSAIDDTPHSPTAEKKLASLNKRRTSSAISGVFKIEDLETEGVDLKIAPETQKLNWKLNSAPTSVDDKEVLKKLLVQPPIRKIDLHFPLGLEVTARNLKGVTIKDALDAIHKQFKKKADDELEEPYLAGFEWDKEECYTKFIVHCKKTGEAPMGGSKKKKNKNKDEEAD